MATTPTPPAPTFQKVAIEPVQCLKAGKELIGDQYWLFVGIVFVGLFIGGLVPFNILLGPMVCGIYLCYLQRERGQPATFEMLFKGFDHFLESFIATLVPTAISMAVMIPGYCLFLAGMFGAAAAAEGGGKEAAAPAAFFGGLALFMLLILVMTILIGVFFMFTYLLIVDRGLKAMPAISASFGAAKANFGGLLGLLFCLMLLSLAGYCLCFVGVYLLAPIGFGAVFVAYRKVFPQDQQTASPFKEA